MEKLEFAILINAPRERVWDAMLQDGTYREWTSAFHEVRITKATGQPE